MQNAFGAFIESRLVPTLEQPRFIVAEFTEVVHRLGLAGVTLLYQEIVNLRLFVRDLL